MKILIFPKMDMHPVCCRRLPSSTMHLLYLGEIMKHVVILLLYLYSLKKSTKTESVCDCRIMVWLCSHFCSSRRPHFLVPHSFMALLLLSKNTVLCLGYKFLRSEF